MTKKLLFGLLILTFISSVSFAACEGPLTTTSPTATVIPTSTPTQTQEAKWWDKFGEPQYGGTINIRISSLDSDFDVSGIITEPTNFWYESLWNMDWTADRDLWEFKTNFLPQKYTSGCLAESWEIPDAQTIIVNLKQGVKWQDREPVNGREFTAYDVQAHYERNWMNPLYIAIGGIDKWESVTALDDYTVQFKFKAPSALWFLYAADTMPVNQIEAPEWTALSEADKQDWQYAVGTGPWIITDYTAGSSMVFTANPDYYGYDERYPDNRLPYADSLKVLCIPDTPTAISALRTGQLDILGAATSFFEPALTWQQAQTLGETNAELEMGQLLGSGVAIDLRCDMAPFNDINVRKALQMAIDRPLIAQTYYGGTVDGTPCGYVNPVLKGYAFAYEDWPQALKDEYTYNTEEAKRLLEQAGYPDGFDTEVVASSSSDRQLLQIIQAQFRDIGVEMSINEMEATVWSNYVSSGKHDAMVYSSCAYDTYPTLINHRWSQNTASNYTYNNDPVYDEIWGQFNTATDPDEAARLQQEADRRAIEEHWSVNLFPTSSYIAWQPYLKGYSGEMRLNFGGGYILARLWVDESLKK